MLQEAVIDFSHRLEKPGVGSAVRIMLKLDHSVIVHQSIEGHDLDVIDCGIDYVAGAGRWFRSGLSQLNDVTDLEIRPLETLANRQIDSPGLLLMGYFDQLGIVNVDLKK